MLYVLNNHFMAKAKTNVYRLYNKETGEHYTLRMSREAYDKLAEKKVKKYSKKKQKHIEFEITKKVK